MNELDYLNNLYNILKYGEKKDDRTGVGTLSVSGVMLKFNMCDQLPILTSKKIPIRIVIEELLWFLRGETNINYLKEKNVHIWDANTKDTNGETGPIYGYQWRYWNGKIDQINNIINLMINEPTSRRILLSAWNVSDVNKGVLPPCHFASQFIIYEKEMIRYVDCILYQRSGDFFLGIPFNITSYCLLTYMLCHVINSKGNKFIYKPRLFTHFIGDAHVYNNHIQQSKEQYNRKDKIYDFPEINFKRKIIDIDDFKWNDFEIKNYKSHETIKADMAV